MSRHLDICSQLELPWEVLLSEGRPFDVSALVPFIQVPEYAGDEALAIYFANKQYRAAGRDFDGRVVQPAAFTNRRRAPELFAEPLEATGDQSAFRLANPPSPRDAHGTAVARAVRYLLAHQNPRRTPFWTLEAARALAGSPCGLVAQHVLAWEVAGGDRAQLLLLEDLEAFCQTLFGAAFRIEPVAALSPQARRWGVGARRDFLARMPGRRQG